MVSVVKASELALSPQSPCAAGHRGLSLSSVLICSDCSPAVVSSATNPFSWGCVLGAPGLRHLLSLWPRAAPLPTTHDFLLHVASGPF